MISTHLISRSTAAIRALIPIPSTQQPCCSVPSSFLPAAAYCLENPSSASIVNNSRSNVNLFLNARKYQKQLCQTMMNSNGGQQPPSADKSHEKPHMHQLEHVQKRLEFTVPLMFRAQQDFTFYSKDVVLEDEIMKMTKVGLSEVMTHLNMISVIGRCWRAHLEVEILNISPILEDGTVRLRWRINYLTWIQLLNPKNYKEEHVKKNMNWFDGYSIFHVDGEGQVYKFTLQKTMPDDSSLSAIKDKTKEFVRRVVMPDSSTAKCASSSSTASMAPIPGATAENSFMRSSGTREEEGRGGEIKLKKAHHPC